MNLRTLKAAITEAERFLNLARELQSEVANGYYNGSKGPGATRRASMELTRAFADLRRSTDAALAQSEGEGPSERIISIAKTVQESAFDWEPDAWLIGRRSCATTHCLGPGGGGGSVNLEQLLRQHDESFWDGSIAVVESIENALNSWQFQLLIRIAPRWTLRKFRERISDVLPLPHAGEVSHG
jgi:hypothetical protein